MIKIVRKIDIDARLDRVFDFLGDPANLPEIWPNLLEVKNIEPSRSTNGYDYEWAYQIADTRFDGKAEIAEYEQYQRIVVQGSKGFETTSTWKFAPHGGKSTRLTFELEYTIPDPALELKDENEIEAEIEGEVETMLENLKSKVEEEKAYAAA